MPSRYGALEVAHENGVVRRCAHGGLSRSLKTDYLDEDTNHSFDVESLSEEHSHSDKRPGFGEVDFNFLGLTIPNDDRSVHVKRMDTYCDRPQANTTTITSASLRITFLLFHFAFKDRWKSMSHSYRFQGSMPVRHRPRMILTIRMTG